ncbi:CDP-alcohol phosphatidyltransferase family protein [Candidatus Omnitrophota bacterium]
MNENKDFVYREKDAGHKELFSMLIYRPLARMLLLGVFKHIKTTPNMITFISLLWTLAGCWFFAFTPYPYAIIGVLLLHIGYVFDMLDGQYARYKDMSSRYGQWFDPFLDVIKAASLFLSLSYGAYASKSDPTALIWGFFGMINCFLAYYIMNTRNIVIEGHTFEIKLPMHIYVGYEITLYWCLSVLVVFNIVYPGLIFLATVGALAWIKLLNTVWKKHLNQKDQIEEG